MEMEPNMDLEDKSRITLLYNAMLPSINYQGINLTIPNFLGQA